ncbi:hypothetical protein EV361DRAFT_1038143, partial [Lentinula raphanica]
MSLHDVLTQTTEEVDFVPDLPVPASPTHFLPRPDEGKSEPVKMPMAALQDLFDFSESLDVEIPDQPMSEEEALTFSQTLDIAEQIHYDDANAALGQRLLLDTLQNCLNADAANSNLNPSSSFPSLPSNVPHATITASTPQSTFTAPSQIPSPSSTECSEWKPGQVQERFINGTWRKACCGRPCASLVAPKVPAKINDNCSFKFCKGCCRQYQLEAKLACKEAAHKPKAPEQSAETPSPLYLHNRPLRPLHYERREQSKLDYHALTTRLENTRAYTNDVQKNVYIRFWNEHGTGSTIVVECPTYPCFRLADCSENVQKAVGVRSDGILETFDPALKIWVLKESTSKQHLHPGEMVLLRSQGCAGGEGMKEAVEVLTSPHSSVLAT